jgi:hypothetical protein
MVILGFLVGFVVLVILLLMDVVLKSCLGLCFFSNERVLDISLVNSVVL